MHPPESPEAATARRGTALRAALSVLVAVLLLAMLPAFFLPNGGLPPELPQQTLFVLGHLLWFAALAWLAPRVHAALADPGLSFPLLLSLGVLVEIVQPLAGRSMSAEDIAVDAAGIALGLACRRTMRHRAAWVLLAALLVGTTAGDALLDAADLGLARLRFPVLADFEQPLEVRRWSRGTRSAALAYEGRHALRLSVGPSGSRGLTLLRGFGDWRGYDALSFAVHSPVDGPRRLHVSIGDGEHLQRRGGRGDRFDRSFDLEEGWNLIEIPLDAVRGVPSGREQDLGRIARFVLYVPRPTRAVALHFDAFRLHRGPGDGYGLTAPARQ